MKKKLLIIGSGGHAKSILDSFRKNNINEAVGFIDEYKNKGETINDLKIVGKIRDIPNFVKNNDVNCFIIGVGDNFLRKSIYEQIISLKLKNFKPISIVDETATISSYSSIGKGCYIAPKTVIQTSTKIGIFNVINTGTIIEHDNKIGNFSSTAPGCVTGGNVKVGNLCHLALSAVIKNNISLGSNTIVGSNSYINKNCKSNSIYFGNPGKFYRKRKLGEKYL